MLKPDDSVKLRELIKKIAEKHVILDAIGNREITPEQRQAIRDAIQLEKELEVLLKQAGILHK